MAVPQTQNLGLNLPPPEVYNQSPNWGALLNQNFQKLDALGNPVTPAGMSIDADLPFNNHSATGLLTVQFNPQSGTFDSGTLSAIYSVSGNLYWNNGAGASVQITDGSSIVGTTGSITGLPSTPAGAGVAYNPTTGFTFTGAGGDNYSNLQTGPLVIYDNAAGPPTQAVVLKSPALLSASYAITLPTALPASGKKYPLLLTHAGDASAEALTIDQMAPQAPVALSLGASWVAGALYWWQDQVGMVHVIGRIQSTGSGSVGAIATMPVLPVLIPGGLTISTPGGVDISSSGACISLSVDLSGVLQTIASFPHSHILDVNFSYLGAT